MRRLYGGIDLAKHLLALPPRGQRACGCRRGEQMPLMDKDPSLVIGPLRPPTNGGVVQGDALHPHTAPNRKTRGSSKCVKYVRING